MNSIPNGVSYFPQVFMRLCGGPKGNEWLGPFAENELPPQYRVAKPAPAIYLEARNIPSAAPAHREGTYLRDAENVIDIDDHGRMYVRYYWQGWQ